MNVDDDDADTPLDPRIKMELENLNNATDDINQLELELDEARRIFVQLQSDLKNQFLEEQNKAGSINIMKAKVYYEAVAARNEAQLKCRCEAELFRKASENLAAAMETESVAMNSFKLHQHKFNESWQEWLNQVTAQVMEDSNKKIASQREHQKITAHYNKAESRVKELSDKYRKALIKTKPYFDIKERIEQELPLQKEKIRCLEKSIQKAKNIYATSLRSLEEISNQIHQQRRDYDIISNGPREPGVGAELISLDESLQFIEASNKRIIIRKNPMESNSNADKKETEQNLKDILNLKRSIENLSGRLADGSESTSNQWDLELQAGLEKLNNPAMSLMQHIKSSSLSYINEPVHPEISQIVPQTKDMSSSIVEQDKSVLLSPRNSFFSCISNAHHQSWHSLTQSPINSILLQSKLALRNSLPKSLANNAVNSTNFSVNKSYEQQEHTIFDEIPIHYNMNKQVNPTEPKSISLTSSAIRTKQFQIFDKNSNRTTELPILSMFSYSKDLSTSKDKSCSMVNLNEKNHLKSMIGKTVINNIQAISIERLANVRSKLIADTS